MTSPAPAPRCAQVRLGTYSARAAHIPPAAIIATQAMAADPRQWPLRALAALLAHVSSALSPPRCSSHPQGGAALWGAHPLRGGARPAGGQADRCALATPCRPFSGGGARPRSVRCQPQPRVRSPPPPPPPPPAHTADMVVPPRALVESAGRLRLHSLYYITKQIIPSLDRAFSLVGADLKVGGRVAQLGPKRRGACAPGCGLAAPLHHLRRPRSTVCRPGLQTCRARTACCPRSARPPLCRCWRRAPPARPPSPGWAGRPPSTGRAPPWERGRVLVQAARLPAPHARAPPQTQTYSTPPPPPLTVQVLSVAPLRRLRRAHPRHQAAVRAVHGAPAAGCCGAGLAPQPPGAAVHAARARLWVLRRRRRRQRRAG